MPADERMLISHRARVDPSAGIAEEFLQPRLGGGSTVAILARPLGRAHPVGWVACHSFGVEQMNLDRVDAVVCRALAAAGFPSLRFHTQGYGDSERRGEPIQPQWHFETATDAAALMAGLEGIERVGMLGARFGAMVAALVADRMELPYLALWQPFPKGDRFLADSYQAVFLADLIGQKQRGGAPGGMKHDLATKGWADVNGFLLRKEVHDEIAALDLTTEVTRFGGTALVGGISRNGSMPPGPATMAAHLRSIGARCDELALADRWAAVFGQHQFQKLPGGETEIDSLFDVSRAIARATARWSLERCARPVDRPGDTMGAR